MLVLTVMNIINYISMTENNLWTWEFLDFFLPDELSAGNTIQTRSFYFLFTSWFKHILFV